MSPLSAPDVLVLGVGGVLGEAWMSGFLAGAAETAGIDFRRAKGFVGTSAGSIVAARLSAGVPPGRARGAGRSAEAQSAPHEARGRTPRDTVGGPLAATLLRTAAPAGALARAALLSRVPDGRMSLGALSSGLAALNATFDGRLRVVAVDRHNGRRVVFGAGQAPRAKVSEAVAASCAVPGVFRPVRIGDRDYVDGGVWSPTNLDVAPIEPGTRVLCLVPTAALEAAPTPLFRALGRGWKIATSLEAAAARSAGAEVTIIEPDARAAASMGRDLMSARPRPEVEAAGFAQGQAAAGNGRQRGRRSA